MKDLGHSGNRVFITVLGKDQVGIIAWITTLLASQDANVLDISQTILQEFFTMVMIVDLAATKMGFKELQDALISQGAERGLQVNVQHEDVFQFMHRI
ncbi:MAG: ACT domain-containing protein [Peptococcaceae bacterium]|nr:ACT domain-containing protein [Peptococcaceae bacterium]